MAETSTAPTSDEIALADRLRPWTTRASHLVARRLSDARSHAELGDMPRARARLDELKVALAGVEQSHGTGLLADARARFLRDGFGLVKFDAAIHRPGLAPTAEMEALARTIPIGGKDRDHSAEARDLAAAAARELAASAGASGPARSAALDAWQARHRERFESLARVHLSDAQVALAQSVARMHVKPELR